jgi:CspA family cold shock protein
MHKGKIKRLIKDRGFGFISDTDGREVFFHRNNLVGVEFERLDEEQTLEFDVENSPKGPRAINIKIASE